MSTTMYKVTPFSYSSANGIVMQRENNTKTPDGVPMDDRWVLRDEDGKLIDYDEQRALLARRHELVLKKEQVPNKRK